MPTCLKLERIEIGAVGSSFPRSHSAIIGSESVLIGLAQALFCEPDSLFAMISSYSLYCDAAGGKDHGFIVVAGYLSTYEKWLAFNREWNILLGTVDLPYFHMKEFAQSRGPFADWKDDERGSSRDTFCGRSRVLLSSKYTRRWASATRSRRLPGTHTLLRRNAARPKHRTVYRDCERE
jgi:hypothetical protein